MNIEKITHYMNLNSSDLLNCWSLVMYFFEKEDNIKLSYYFDENNVRKSLRKAKDYLKNAKEFEGDNLMDKGIVAMKINTIVNHVGVGIWDDDCDEYYILHYRKKDGIALTKLTDLFLTGYKIDSVINPLKHIIHGF